MKSQLEKYKDELIFKYDNGSTCSSLGREYNVDRKTISDYLQSLGIKIRTYKDTSFHKNFAVHDKAQEIKYKYLEGLNCTKLGKEYNVARTTIAKILKNVGVDVKTSSQGGFNRKYEVNHDFFEVLTKENSYWAGFIAADGHVMANNNGVILSISLRDKQHLEKFRKAVRFTGEIKEYTYDTGFKDNVSYAKLSIYSKKLFSDVETLWNIVPNKTKILKFPESPNQDCLFAFICGYIDGDGSFILGKDRVRSLDIGSASKTFLEDVKVFLIKYLELGEQEIKIYNRKRGNNPFSVLQIFRKSTLHKLKSHVLENFTELPFLERKWNRLFLTDFSYKNNESHKQITN